MKLPSLLTPRGSRPSKEQSLALPLGALQQPADCFDEPAAATPRTRSKLLGKLGSLLTPRARGQAAAAADSPASSGLIAAYRPTLTGLMEHQLRLRMAQQEVVGGGGSVSSRTSRPTAPSASALEAESDDAASDSGSDLSSLDGFGDYARQRGLGSVAETEQEEGPGSAAAPAADPDRLP